MVKDYRQQTIFVPNIFVMISPRHNLIFVKHELRLARTDVDDSVRVT